MSEIEMSEEEMIQALGEAVSLWRMQEYVEISFYTFYIYYVLITMDKDVSIIFPQKWNRGKVLYVVCRYGMLVHIALHLARDYRNYFVITPVSCKVLQAIYDIALWLVFLASDLALGLCLSALLGAGKILAIIILILFAGPAFISFIFTTVGGIQAPADPITSLDEELGYPCYITSSDQWETTIAVIGEKPRAYVGLAVTAVLVVLAFVIVVRRYKNQTSRLFQTIRRDGGLYYISLLALRLASVILRVTGQARLETSAPAAILYSAISDVLIPILAQRLMINMRKVDYVGTRPYASTLLFARSPPGSEYVPNKLGDSLELYSTSSGPEFKGDELGSTSEKSGTKTIV